MNYEEHFAPIAALDLDPIKVKLMHAESGEGWSREYADEVEFEYRRFLYLVKKFPNEQAAPLFDVDVFWHYHILDTMKYAADCEAVFGYFLHHFPYVGLRGEADMEAHHRVGERMRELYELTYGEAYVRQEAQNSAAFCVPTSKAAFSIPTFSVPNLNAAVSSGAARFAFSIPTATQAPPDRPLDTEAFNAPELPAAAIFSSVRPTLSPSA